MDPFAESPPGTPAQEAFDADVFRLRGQFLIGRFQTKNGQHRAETKGGLEVSIWMDDIIRPMALGGQLKVVKAAEDDDEDWEDLGGWLEEGNVRTEEEEVGEVEGLVRGMAAVEFAEEEGIKEQHEFWEDVEEEEEEDEDMIFVEANGKDTGDKVAGRFEETAPADDA